MTDVSDSYIAKVAVQLDRLEREHALFAQRLEAIEALVRSHVQEAESQFREMARSLTVELRNEHEALRAAQVEHVEIAASAAQAANFEVQSVRRRIEDAQSYAGMPLERIPKAIDETLAKQKHEIESVAKAYAEARSQVSRELQEIVAARNFWRWLFVLGALALVGLALGKG